MNKGKLIGIGVGPGDAELLTVKAARVLKEADVICAPKSGKSKPSLALSIVQKYLDDRNRDYKLLEPLFPMIEDERILNDYWDEAAGLVVDKLEQGMDVAFITLGDPSIYSTFSYISRRIEVEGYSVEIIPGITSFTGCAAAADISLGEKDEIIVIVPKVDERLERILQYGDTFVVMKTSRHLDDLERVVSRDKRNKEIVSIQNCGLDDERIFKDFVKDKKYLSTTILKFKK